jgi:hypothetical protein
MRAVCVAHLSPYNAPIDVGYKGLGAQLNGSVAISQRPVQVPFAKFRKTSIAVCPYVRRIYFNGFVEIGNGAAQITLRRF